MRTTITFCLFIVLLLPGFSAKAQSIDELAQDARGRYYFSHSSQIPDVSKDMLYERLKLFVVEDLNASDTYIEWDETGHDSIKTVAFFELDNSGDISNQIVDCKARLDFSDGTATLKLSGFNYSVIAGGKAYAQPLHQLGPIPYYAQSYVKMALSETLRQLADKMDHAAAGVGQKKLKQNVKRQGTSRGSTAAEH